MMWGYFFSGVLIGCSLGAGWVLYGLPMWRRRRMRRVLRRWAHVTVNGRSVYKDGELLRAGDIREGDMFQVTPSPDGDHYVVSELRKS